MARCMGAITMFFRLVHVFNLPHIEIGGQSPGQMQKDRVTGPLQSLPAQQGGRGANGEPARKQRLMALAPLQGSTRRAARLRARGQVVERAEADGPPDKRLHGCGPAAVVQQRAQRVDADACAHQPVSMPL